MIVSRRYYCQKVQRLYQKVSFNMYLQHFQISGGCIFIGRCKVDGSQLLYFQFVCRMVWFIRRTTIWSHLFQFYRSTYSSAFSSFVMKDSSNRLSYSSCNIHKISYRVFDESPGKFGIVHSTLTHFLTSYVSHLCVIYYETCIEQIFHLALRCYPHVFKWVVN